MEASPVGGEAFLCETLYGFADGSKGDLIATVCCSEIVALKVYLGQ